jgi:hypothetical protein
MHDAFSYTTPMLAQFLSCVCDHNMTLITSARDGDHKHETDARMSRKVGVLYARPLWPKYS